MQRDFDGNNLKKYYRNGWKGLNKEPSTKGMEFRIAMMKWFGIKLKWGNIQ